MNRRASICWVFFAAFLVGLLAAVIGYVSLVNRAGRGYCPYSFVPLYHQYKCERLKRVQSPKIIFLGGSSAQECLLPDVISRELGMDVVLAGTFVDIPMRFYPAMLRDTLKPGDVIYLMLENLHYARGEDVVLSTVGVSMLLGVDASMRETLRPKERFDLYVKKGLGWLQCVIPKRIPRQTYRRYRSCFLYEMVQKYAGSDKLERIGTYGEDTGNFMATCPEDILILQPGWFSDEFRQSFDAILKLAQARNARVIIGNNVNYSYPKDTGVPRFCEEQAKLGVPICCSPLELCLPYGCFSDTIMHCSGAGRKYVTHQVVRGLKRILNDTDEPDVAWPLAFFIEAKPDFVSFDLPETCRGRESFAELILDRGRMGCTNVVRRVLVNGRDVAFSECVHPAKNTLWTRWRDESGRADVRIEFLDPASGCRGERILVEPYRFDELLRMDNFNDVAGFSASGDNPRRYVATAESGHLAFRVPEWASNRYRCIIRVRLDCGIEHFFYGGVRSFRWIRRNDVTKDDVSELKIVPNESGGFVDEKGDAVFGLWLYGLKPGTTVELVSCEFSMV